MKKTFLAAALAFAAVGAFAQTVSVEYNYNNVAGQDQYNQYGYVGMAMPTAVGVFDAGLQGVWTTTQHFGTDRARGYEVGYGYPLSLGTVRLSPRIAYGQMNKIDPAGSGFQLNARYYLASLEASKNIAGNLGGYVAVSHMNGLNGDSVARANRLQFGVDYTLTPQMGVRLGLSTQKFGDTQQNGAVVIGTYSF